MKTKRKTRGEKPNRQRRFAEARWLDRRYSGCKTGIEIQARTNQLAAMEMRDINDALERYDNWKRWYAHPSQLPSPAV